MENKIDITAKATEWYIANQSIYKKLASKVENILSEVLDLNGQSYHIITSRSKDIESFKNKINKDKYDDPIRQITDLAGIRIITYVEDEVNVVCKTIEQAFEIDSQKSLDKSKELGIDKVGYKSVHYVGKLKADRLKLPEYGVFDNKYFEIQVRTILQHAWAEIEHDRNYKFSGKLPDEISRRFKLLAGTLEILDREFNSIASEIDMISKQVEAGVKQGKLNFELNSTSIKQYIDTRFKKIKDVGKNFKDNIEEDLLKELESFGIMTLQDLDTIVPKGYAEEILKEYPNPDDQIPIYGFLRALLILKDPDQYFIKSWNGKWQVWSVNGKFKDIFEHYKVDWGYIKEKYEVALF